MAPEVLECKPYGKSSDLWSIGVISYLLISGHFPFYNKNNAILYENIRCVDYEWPSGLEVTNDAKDFVRNLLVKNPETRYPMFYLI